MNNWLAALLVGLGTMQTVELIKTFVPWPLQAWVKMAVTSLVALGGGILLNDGWGAEQTVVFGLGSAGLACLLHEVVSLLSLASDNYKQQVILRYGNRRRA